ncbi:MAG: hypothetical protein QOE77_3037 [Blastocatellia bacterium]|jgi:superfamily II DNA/RNA helicase/HKD family nuclease|nr:hypothetical protein [Blastocatellia bacterium]
MSSDLTFLTNEPGKSLLDRFYALLGTHTQSFDCLVGYFMISGFYKLYPALEHAEKIRILIGLKTDQSTYNFLQQAKEQQQLLLSSHAEAKSQIPGDILEELEQAEDSPEVENGVNTFISWVKSGKLEIKVYPSEKIHAKVYIMTFPEGHYDKGRVITGSSNFSQSGLVDNLEFNVELKNRSDYEFAIAKFNELWADSVEVSQAYVNTITKFSPYAEFKPYELYLKFLYEYFKGRLNLPDELEDIYLPAGFMKLKYQEEAVLSARDTLETYGGVFLSDVVGLGKTYMSALLAQQLEGRSLVIAPPALIDENNPGSWNNVFREFAVRGFKCESLGKLDELLKRDLSFYKNVFIDESHRFRTESTQSYEKLARICRGKRVVLVSATPLNNTPRDILSQIKLFQNGKKSTIPNQPNLEAFFANMEKKLRGLDRKDDREEYFATVQANAKATRERVLKYLMVRRTRSEIKKYFGDDLTTQGLKFPEVKDPEPLFYKFNTAESKVFFDTLKLITDIKYARYKPLVYFTGKRDDSELQGQKNLAKFMKILLVKRLESSFFAFRNTLSRFVESYERVIKEYNGGFVYISKDHISKVFQFLDEDNPEGIERLLEQKKAERLDADDFSPDFISELKSDLKVLKKIQAMWESIIRDPKWNSFRDELKTKRPFRKNKLIIFTESKETAEYLADRIEVEIDPKVILFSGASGPADREKILANFDPRAFQPKDDYRILVTTEVLSEGVNLHRANIVVNYDIPWNPTRMIQRVGRVNRVDTEFDTIHTYNFFPTDESEDVIKLKAAAEAKIEAFIEMLGADARLLTEGEEIKSHDLFMRLNSRKTITGEDESEESELEYLAEIRALRDNRPDLFERIKRLPKKARSTRKAQELASSLEEYPALITYFRQGKLDKFFLAQASTQPSAELDFFAAVKLLKPKDEDEKRLPITREFYSLLESNKRAFLETTAIEGGDGVHHRNSPNDAYILKRLKAKDIRKFQGFTDDDETYLSRVIGLLDDGALPKPTTKKVATALKKEAAPLRVLGILKRDIPLEFFQATPADASRNAYSPREVILSSFIPGPADRGEQ